MPRFVSSTLYHQYSSQFLSGENSSLQLQRPKTLQSFLYPSLSLIPYIQSVRKFCWLSVQNLSRIKPHPTSPATTVIQATLTSPWIDHQEPLQRGRTASGMGKRLGACEIQLCRPWLCGLGLVSPLYVR